MTARPEQSLPHKSPGKKSLQDDVVGLATSPKGGPGQKVECSGPQSALEDEAGDEGSERAARFRILTVDGRRRAFALEPIFWSILEDAAHEESMRLGEYVSSLLAEASRANHSALLRVKAAEWVDRRRERLREKGFLAVGRRIAASHAAPCFLIDQKGAIVGHNKAFGDLLRSHSAGVANLETMPVQLRLGVTVADMMRILKATPEKFMRVRFSLLFDGFERPGVLNAMYVGEEQDTRFALALVQSAGEIMPRR